MYRSLTGQLTDTNVCQCIYDTLEWLNSSACLETGPSSVRGERETRVEETSLWRREHVR